MIETLRDFDYRLFHLVNQSMANPLLDLLCPIFRDIKFISGCYFIFSFLLYKSFPEHFLKIALAGAFTFLLTDQLSAHFVKAIVHRVRPCNNFETGARLIIEHCGSGFSFVSSHATNSFGIAAFISMLSTRRPITILVLLAWASLISFSQVYVGVHYPADVAGGAILGLVIGTTTGFIVKTKFDLKSTTY